MILHLKLGQVCINKNKREFVCRYIPLNTANRTMHWTMRSKWTNAWKAEVMAQVQLNRKNLKIPLEKAKIKIILNTARIMDFDGAYNSVKPILDGLKKGNAGIIIDDSPKYIELEVKQIKVDHIKDQFVEIIIS